MLIGYHASCSRQDSGEYSQVEEYGAMWGDFKVKEQVWINDCGEEQNCRKRARDERNKSTIRVSSGLWSAMPDLPHDQPNLLIRELPVVH